MLSVRRSYTPNATRESMARTVVSYQVMILKPNPQPNHFGLFLPRWIYKGSHYRGLCLVLFLSEPRISIVLISLPGSGELAKKLLATRWAGCLSSCSSTGESRFSFSWSTSNRDLGSERKALKVCACLKNFIPVATDKRLCFATFLMMVGK